MPVTTRIITFLGSGIPINKPSWTPRASILGPGDNPSDSHWKKNTAPLRIHNSALWGLEEPAESQVSDLENLVQNLGRVRCFFLTTAEKINTKTFWSYYGNLPPWKLTPENWTWKMKCPFNMNDWYFQGAFVNFQGTFVKFTLPNMLT